MPTKFPNPVPSTPLEQLCVLIVFIVICILFTIAFFWVLRKYKKVKRLLREGIETMGVVVDVEPQYYKPARYEPILEYEDLMKRKYRIKALIRRKRPVAGETMPVFFFMDDPADAMVDPSAAKRSLWWMIIFLPVPVLLIFLAICVFIIELIVAG